MPTHYIYDFASKAFKSPSSHLTVQMTKRSPLFFIILPVQMTKTLFNNWKNLETKQSKVNNCCISII